MKVYVITQGEYSDYGICAVSLDKDDAERKCALLNRNVRNGEYCEIEEYDTDDMVADINEEVKKKFKMVVNYKTGEVMWISELYLTLDDVNDILITKPNVCFALKDKYIEVVATLSKDTTEEQAKKIMLDRIAKFKAERAGL